MQIAVIIPAAGTGRRFAASEHSKIEWPLGGKPVFLRAAELFLNRDEVSQILVAVPPAELEQFKGRWGDKLALLGIDLIAGGRVERWETVLTALRSVGEQATHIAVHDAARPLTSAGLIDRLFAAARHHAAVVPALPVSATLKRLAAPAHTGPESASATNDQKEQALDAILGSPGQAATPMPPVRQVMETVPRDEVATVQTPQVFAAELLRRAYAPLRNQGPTHVTVTDDAGLVEALGEPVVAVEGEPANLKLTHPADAELAQALVAYREPDTSDRPEKRLFADDEDF